MDELLQPCPSEEGSENEAYFIKISMLKSQPWTFNGSFSSKFVYTVKWIQFAPYMLWTIQYSPSFPLLQRCTDSFLLLWKVMVYEARGHLLDASPGRRSYEDGMETSIKTSPKSRGCHKRRTARNFLGTVVESHAVSAPIDPYFYFKKENNKKKEKHDQWLTYT